MKNIYRVSVLEASVVDKREALAEVGLGVLDDLHRVNAAEAAKQTVHQAVVGLGRQVVHEHTPAGAAY